MDDTRKHVVNNIFLPRKLPQSAVSSRGEFVREFAEVLSKDVVNFHALKEAERMLKVWSRVQGASISWELVHNGINKLLPGETFSLYLTAQNAGLTISIGSEPVCKSVSKATLAVFRVAANTGKVMQAGGELSEVFPSWAVTTDAKRVQSESFAKQVADLANTEFLEMLPKSRKARTEVPERRDVADPSYVTAWLLMAVAGQSLITGEKGVGRVRKKIRDDVLWKDTELPWRRSGEYMTVKSVLHSTLVGKLGEQEGLILYKYILIQVMTRILQQNHDQLETDIVLQMLRKLARRFPKLSHLMDRGVEMLGTSPTIRPEVRFRVHLFLEQSSTTVVDIRAFIDKRWQGIIKQEECESQVVVDMSKLDFEKHVTHSLVNAGQHLQLALDSSLQPIPIKVNDPICSNRNTSSALKLDYLVNCGSSIVDVGQALYDFEVWVQKVLWHKREEYSILEYSTVYLTVLTTYLDLAKRYYEDDAVGSSRMVMTTIILVAMLDFMATRKHALLLTYHHGVNVAVLQSLLLIHRSDIEHLATLEAYFAARSKDQSLKISLISEDRPTPKSFSVCFADKNPHLQKIRAEILEVAAEKEREKLKEVSTQREIHGKLVESTKKVLHQYVNNRWGYARVHSSRCSRCQLEDQASDMRVNVYERPLPEEPHLQNAVVFELATPVELSVLRDALHVLNRDVFGIQMKVKKKSWSWLNCKPLKTWIPPQKHKRLTSLCSISKLFSASHYSSLHPSAADEDFIKPNGFNVHLMEPGGDKYASTACYKTEANLSSLALTVDGIYDCLRWTIASATHDENEVLARQVQCPPRLNLAEFKKFGLLRAGHRLQIRNISRVLEMQTLSLFQPSVVNLFSQALWQTGPPLTSGEASNTWVREVNLDLQVQPFAEYMIQQLLFLLERNRENWKDHLGLMSIVVIGARILAISEAAWEERASSLLRSCRVVAESWLEKIEQLLGELSSSSIQNIQEIRLKLVDVAAFAALTFDVDVHHLKLILRSEADVTSWLRTVTRIHDNILLNSESLSNTFAGVFQRNLLRRVQNTALRLEGALDKWVTDSDCLSGFVSEHWADAGQGQIGSWIRYDSPCERWWKTTFEHKSGRKMTLQMDILRGSFLMNGCPVARLPTTITSHPDYGRVFGKHVFQVQPAAGSTGSFVTCHKLNGSNFKFALLDDNRLLVTERRSDGCELELFPSRLFEGDLPRLLIKNHSHWILKASNFTHMKLKPRFKHMDPDETMGCILFRPVKFDDSGFADIEGVPFVLNIRSRRVRDTKTDRNLVDIRSRSFKVLHDEVLHRLELPEFVHLFDNRKDGTIAAELPRMGLRFDVVPKTGVFWSCEHPGFSVSKKQNIGTLIGLQHGLLLEEHSVPDHCTRKHSLIIPHTVGLLKREMADFDTKLGQHPVVWIDLKEFSSPSFFVFEVDHRLQNLRGPASGPTAWLYLALLHASTSHVLPDPFTGLTGTESAMRLLQSPRCWSCMPYKHEATSILQAIAKLSPQREWYPPNLRCMQTVTWPVALFSCAALDAFRLVVEKLVSDSERLRFLFPGSDQVPVLPQADSTLLLKYYWRSREAFGKEAHMDSSNEKHWGGPPASSSIGMNLGTEEFVGFQRHEFIRGLAEAGHKWRNLAIPRKKNLLSSLLLHCHQLSGASGGEMNLRDSAVSSWRTMAKESFKDKFLDFYNLARKVEQHNNRESFTFLLSVLAYLSVDPLVLSILHCVAVHAMDFENVTPPKYETFECTDQAGFDMGMVTRAVNSNVVSFDEWMTNHGGNPHDDESWGDFSIGLRREYDQDKTQNVKTIIENAQRLWPLPNYVSTSSSGVESTTVNYHSAMKEINEFFTRWRHNKELHTFVANVETKIVSLCYQPGVKMGPAPLQAPINYPTSATMKSFHFEMPVLPFTGTLEVGKIFQTGNFGTAFSDRKASKPGRHEPPAFPLQQSAMSCEIAKKFITDLETSWQEHHRFQPEPPRDVVKEQLAEALRVCKVKSRSLWTQIGIAVQPCCIDPLPQALEAAGLWRKALPTLLLPCIISDKGDTFHMNLNQIRVALGAVAVLWTLEQQLERCLRMLQLTQSPAKDVALQKELANIGHLNWHPNLWPKWLILELEGDYLMRAIQVDVTRKMLHPSGNKNAVLQLNMGEGKTSVIVPALCASIPDGTQFARLTVLGSLFRMNFDALVSKLGGLLNQRVYTFPYRRDITIDAHGVQKMQEVYQECITKHGVVVMRPEHRLSTILKGLELCRFGSTAGLAAAMRTLHDMVEKKARDILDESDLLLHVKYQVVYTVGEQMNLDGGDLRWKVAQSVLRSAQRHCSALFHSHGAEKIELRAATEGKFAFPHIRILDGSIGAELCEKIADDILQGADDNLPLRELRRNDGVKIRSFILGTGTVSFASIKSIYNEGPILETILILRGLLCYGTLMHALQMRWRVQYGVRPSGIPRMAVPFRAKDVPVERAEFGHPDLAIMLTQLSYYHGGLSDAQLLEAFDRLHRSSTSESEYQRWLGDVSLKTLPKTLHTFSSVNLDDFMLRTEVLFPILRRNMQVINFWLATAVFPIEAKMFEGKLVASAWDLSDSSKGGHPVSGFSGTKDTSLLLPSSITQHDLPELQGTDGAVIAKLLQEENSSYESFPSCISSVEILQRVVEKGARVLLDVGALMVDMSNRNVAVEWLKKLPDLPKVQAAIYFDEEDQIMSIDRDGRSAPLALSPFHRQMDRCIVYLDDMHTRGTDLKIPHGSHACVTLGRGITKDRLVQACMRMRMLGEGHSVSFWASQEVHTSIQQSSSNDNFTSIEVLHWVIRNTVEAIKEGFRHWGAQGVAHARKKVVDHMYESKQGVDSLEKLGLLSIDPEVAELETSYGGERKETMLRDIMKSRLDSAAKEMAASINHGAEIMVGSYGSSVTSRIEKYACQVKCFAQVLDEEQERELEHELEEEEEVQRPGCATPRKPSLSRDLQLLARWGIFDPKPDGDFLPLMDAIQGTPLLEMAESHGWSDKLFVTREFATVLSAESVSSGVPFLRPVAWCVVSWGSPMDQFVLSVQQLHLRFKTRYPVKAIVLLSPFEANELLPDFRRGEGAQLHMFAPRIRQGQNLMLCDYSLTLPVGGSNKNEPVPDSLIAQLLAFSGSAFFANAREQDAYCEFLGLCPRPRSRIEDDLFQRGDIQLDGFFPPETRQLVVKIEGVSAFHNSEAHRCAFQKSPVVFITKLLSARGWMGHASASHAGQILFIGQRARIGNTIEMEPEASSS